MNIPFLTSPNFYATRQGKPITHIVIHSMSGSFDGTKETFLRGTGKDRVSAHYLMAKDGRMLQMVHDEDRAWHVCNANPFTIGIEHEDAFFTRLGNGKFLLARTAKDDPNWMTDKMFNNSVQLVAELIKKHNIPVDKLEERVIGHNNPFLVQYGNNHSDPEKFFPWTKYYAAIRSALGGTEGTKASDTGV